MQQIIIPSKWTNVCMTENTGVCWKFKTDIVLDAHG